MAVNFLEQLLAEWYEYQGYWVQRNVKVGRRERGGWRCELHVVAYHPSDRQLAHIEASTDADSWSARERRFKRKFDAGRAYIRELHPGVELPPAPEGIAVIGYGSDTRHETLGGGRVLMLGKLLRQIADELARTPPGGNAVPERYTILRTLQAYIHYCVRPSCRQSAVPAK